MLPWVTSRAPMFRAVAIMQARNRATAVLVAPGGRCQGVQSAALDDAVDEVVRHRERGQEGRRVEDLKRERSVFCPPVAFPFRLYLCLCLCLQLPFALLRSSQEVRHTLSHQGDAPGPSASSEAPRAFTPRSAK